MVAQPTNNLLFENQISQQPEGLGYATVPIAKALATNQPSLEAVFQWTSPELSQPLFFHMPSVILPSFLELLGPPQLSLAPQTCPSLPTATSTSQCLPMSSQCSSLLDSVRATLPLTLLVSRIRRRGYLVCLTHH